LTQKYSVTYKRLFYYSSYIITTGHAK